MTIAKLPQNLEEEVQKICNYYKIDCLLPNSLNFIFNTPFDIEYFEEHCPWKKLSSEYKLSEDFVRYFKKKIEWNRLSVNPHVFSLSFIEEYFDLFNENGLLQTYKFPTSFLDKHFYDFDLSKMLIFQKLDDAFCLKYKKDIMPYWERIRMFQRRNVSERVLRILSQGEY